MNSLKQAELSRTPAILPAMLKHLVVLFFALGAAGCHLLPKARTSAGEVESSSPANWYHQAACEQFLRENGALQHEIDRLQKQLAEKEAYIRSQEARYQDQVKVLQQSSSSQAAHAQVKLRRLATRPAAASSMAEVEVLMRNLHLGSGTDPEIMLQSQAQRLLNAATAAYQRDDFGAAVEYAAQAREFIGMINNRARKTPDSLQSIVSFHVPLSLRAIENSNLRQKPGLNAQVLGTVKKGTAMTSDAYRGEWLQVLTADGRSGWIFSELVEAQVAHTGRGAVRE